MKPEITIRGFLYLALFLFVLILAFVGLGHCQTVVSLAPYPQLQFFDQTGKPLSFGCVFTYQSNTVNPLATYQDFAGIILNPNPVILSAGGSANIWLQAGQAYTFTIKAAGGTNCSAGTMQYTVNGIASGTTQQITPITPVGGTATFILQSQDELFTITLTGNVSSQPLSVSGVIPPSLVTFQITQDGVGGHSFSWPSNVIGGAPIGLNPNQVTTQMFLWNGSNATALGPATVGTGPAESLGSATASVSITSPFFQTASANPALSGVFRMASSDVLAWRNNANGADVLLAKDISDNLNWPNGLTLGGGSVLATTNQSGGGSICMTVSCALTTPALNGVTISGTPTNGQVLEATSPSAATWSSLPSIALHSRTTMSTNITPAANTTTTVLTKALTMPSSGCPCRVLVEYSLYLSFGVNGANFDSWVSDGTNIMASSQIYSDASGRTPGIHGSETSPVTYANGANVTFTLSAIESQGNTITAGPAQGIGTNGYMTLDIIPAN